MKITTGVKKILMSTLLAYRRLLLYGAIGVTALGLEISIFYFLSQILGINIALGNAAAMLVGFLFGFVLNARYSFRVYDRPLERLMRYGLVTFGGYLISTAVIFVSINFAGTSTLAAKLISLPIFFAFQYNCHRLFTFYQPATVSE